MDKSYVATARLGVATDSEDREGQVVSESDGWRDVRREALDTALASLTGDILQVPPRFSAKKVGGEAAHRRVRRGEDVSLEARPVTVHELEVMDFRPPDVRFRIRCSSGTYVRSVARDLGDALGVGAHLTELRRTSVGRFSVEGALTLDALAHLPRVAVDEIGEGALSHGKAVAAPELPDGGPALAARDGRLVAVGEVRDASFRPRKVFA
jgi:tRNA pseudouridine55 synthase